MAAPRRSFLPGIILILIGLFLLGDRLNLPWPGFDVIYPVLFIIFGLAGAARIRLGDQSRQGVFSAFFWLTLGLFFLLRNLDYIPYRPWPWEIVVTAIGMGFLGRFLFRPSEWGTLVPAAAFLFLGGGALLDYYEVVYFPFCNLQRYWPVLLIAIGVGLVINGVRKAA
ncbi:MAG: DUF5668 domain-containing protein [candidate division KSB1 bacterium]|nr:DUF5668 domain-containing protein [candidate division KSB1 bacterium]MDZ7272634.1 DUF5668 domain-containing protein [candidate division KSB1 bacterium]MDZ7284344.1 DUF5668 domain-containing protein [candidate division KSB1 bacterium]MDZ7297260.1 DUF5668 domain-containing protein [candidate division KSB1 bacterium]MDZ7307564.1 DUF5668 domain-containing protein [candidate division KSB1 bacterium]